MNWSYIKLLKISENVYQDRRSGICSVVRGKHVLHVPEE